MRNPSDNWEELRDKVLGLGDTSVHKTHYPSLKERLAELEQLTRELKRSEAYLAEAQTLSHTGSFGWKVSPEEHIWSEETSRIFEFDPAVRPTMEQIIERVHPEDRTLVTEALARATESGQGFDYEHRLLMPDGRVKHLRVLAKAIRDASGGIEFVGAVMDVTEARLADEKIRQSEAELRELIDAIPQQVYVFGPDWSPLFANLREREYTGLSLEETQSIDAVVKVIHPEDMPRLRAIRERALSEGASVEIGTRIRGKDGQYRWFLIRDNPLRDEQGRIIRWYGTRTDIEDRKRAEAKVRQSEAELRQLIDAIPQQVVVFGPDWRPVFANQRELEYTGLTLEEVRSEVEAPKVLHPEDRKKIVDERARANINGTWTEVEARVRRKDGQYRWFLIRFNPLRDEQGRILRWYGTRTEIEDRKRAEEELRESETRFRTFVDHAADAFFVHDQDHKILDVNRQACENLGYTREELIGMHPLDFDPDIDAAQLQRIRERLAAGEVFTFETRHRRKDGAVFPVEVRLRSFWRGDRRLHLSLVRDITERKQAEEALRQSEESLRLTLEATQIGAFDWDVAHDVWYASPTYYTALGYEPREGPGDRAEWVERLHPDDRDRFKRLTHDILTGEIDRYEYEARLRHADGSYRWAQVKALGIEHDSNGKVSRLLGVRIDITERKQAEEDLRRSESYLADAQRLTHTGVWAGDRTSKPLYWSEEVFRIFGFDPQQGLPTGEQALERIHPEDFDKFRRATINEKGYLESEYRLVLPDGTLKYVFGSAHPVLDRNGEIVEVVGVIVDITERKRAEEALRRAEGYLVEAQRLTHTGAWATDAVPEPLYWSEELFRLYGLDPQQGFPTHDQAVQRVHPEDRDRYVQAFHRVIHQKVNSDVEFRTVLPDGTIRYLYGLGHPVLNTNGDVVEVVGTTVDITERKRAEEALRESETLFRTFVDHAEDAFFMLDLEQGTIIDVNRCACESLGYTRQELIGKTPLAFDVNLDRTTLESTAAQAAAGGTVVFDRHWHRRKDGSLFPVEVQTSAFSHGGRPFLLKVARDITERIKAEEAIRQSEKELRDVIQTMPSIALTSRPDGSVEFVNQRWQDYTGLPMEESTGSGWHRMIHPQDLDGYLEKKRAALGSGKAYEGEFRIRSGATGEYRWFLSRVVPLGDERGNILRWYGTVTDIDDRKQAEEKLQHENVALREEIDKAFLFEEIVGSSAALRAVLSRVAKVAPTDSTVLITGETGTGKELIARAIHKRSRRSARAFVSANCAAIPRDLISSELFGHEKGAFTGAIQRHLGRFELAEGGTIFLDEIAELPAETQVALLRVLQEREFERVGGERPIRSNVRVIAATNRDLEAAVAAGSFRSDLFYRLNVFPVEVPPLRDRKEDIPLLVEYFIDRYARKAGKSFHRVNRRSLDLLQSYRWPGNIRELQNIIERSVMVCESESFSVDESWLSSQSFAEEPKSNVALSDMLAAKEKETIEAALRECGGRVSGPSGAAAKLGMPRSTLESKIRSLDINKSRFKSN